MSVSVYDHGKVPPPNELATLKALVAQLRREKREVRELLMDIYRNSTYIHITPDQALEEYRMAGTIALDLLTRYEDTTK